MWSAKVSSAADTSYFILLSDFMKKCVNSGVDVSLLELHFSKSSPPFTCHKDLAYVPSIQSQNFL